MAPVVNAPPGHGRGLRTLIAVWPRPPGSAGWFRGVDWREATVRAYTSTVIGDDGKPSVVSMEVSEFEATVLDAFLFEIPQGLNAAMDVGEFARALSDANEKNLETAEIEASARKPGIIRIGIPEPTNQTATAVDTRALRADLVESLTGSKFMQTLGMGVGLPLRRVQNDPPPTAPGVIGLRQTE